MTTYDEFHAHVGELVLAEVPDAEEGTSYAMPAWKSGGKPVLGLNRAKTHIGVYPFSSTIVSAVSDRLDGFTLTKGGIQCTPDKPVPDDVITEMVRLRMAEIRG